MHHVLKTWPEAWDAIRQGLKKYEIRKNDRDYKVGDSLYLREYDPKTEGFSGRALCVEITYMTPGGSWGIPAGLCVLSIKNIHWPPTTSGFPPEPWP